MSDRPVEMSHSRITGRELAAQMLPTERARILSEGMKPADATRQLATGDPAHTAETLRAMSDPAAAKELLARMKVSDAAGVLAQPGMTELGANALHGMRPQKAAEVLTELSKNNGQQAASLLEVIHPEKGMGLVKRMEKGVASGLAEQVSVQVRSDLVERLGPARGADLLGGFRSPGKVVETLQHVSSREGVFRKLDASTKIEVISQTSASKVPEYVTGALGKMRTRETARVLTGVMERQPERAASTLGAMEPEAGARAVQRMERPAASTLLEQAPSQVGGAVVEHLKPRKAAELLQEMPSAKAQEVVAHVSREKVLAQLNNRLEEVGSQAALSEAQAQTAVRALESSWREGGVQAAGRTASSLGKGELARAYERMEPTRALGVLQHMEEKKARAALGAMEPEAAARLVQAADDHVERLLEKMPEKQLVPLFEKLIRSHPQQAGQRLMELRGVTKVSVTDIRVKVVGSMRPEASARLWEHMGNEEAAELSRLLPAKTLDRIVQAMEPRAVLEKLQQMDAKTAADLLLKLDEEQGKRTRQLRTGLGIAGTSALAGVIDQLPIVGQHGGFAHIVENSHVLIESYLGAQTATLLVGNLSLRAASAIRIPKKVPGIGGKVLLQVPNLYQIYYSAGWASIGYGSQSLVMHFLH